MYVCASYMCLVPTEAREDVGSLELELLCRGNQIQVLCKTDKCISLAHLFLKQGIM